MCKGTADWRNAKWRLRFQSEDLTAAFRKFSHASKIWVFRLHSLTSHLSFSPFGPQSQMHIKRFIRPWSSISFTGGKRTGTSKSSDYVEQKEMSIKQSLILTDMCRLMTTQLAEALEGYPLYSQDGKGKEAGLPCGFYPWFCKVVYPWRKQEDEDVILFGIVVGLLEDEYGYISLNELSDVGAWPECSGVWQASGKTAAEL